LILELNTSVELAVALDLRADRVGQYIWNFGDFDPSGDDVDDHLENALRFLVWRMYAFKE